ncbi:MULTISPECIES: aldehyde dehydrogenase family protein [unclassified Marinobacter]|jgi:acyl-CoA reductase-like NAD-dependent aldehyde dehydrogenase|uniref:aldehyde dehydrogenase family protein n=1 Tax=unclassified Marinobacter TaxID=83889 RepID=UPI00200E95AC|nr:MULTISPECIES: aldehyde dehydrogenase family protein [unclassified Marinobacter]MCL1481439.1 aldehyde dehydrogenase family protein [Marinobacter sp.]UQG54514.1 aldehyde dehydrogenase family protein [Marinobacter sp. M4C]UQG63319.1 aldehyde dehydrogenase family protein [Marinobacter sp. M2C]UQG67599.1 aldehyde dehydrogenase family protein [Marinobacter sp. M1C]
MKTEIEALHLIGGERYPSVDDCWAESLDPSSGDRIGRFADGGEREAQAAIEAARRAFRDPVWSHNPRLRQQVLLEWAARLEEDGEALAELLTRENGKVISQSRGELAATVSELRYYAGLARHNPGHVLEVAPGEFSTILREPAGVAALIIPWNAPATLLARAIGPALAAGCTVVVKPAPQTPLITAALLEPLSDLEGLPKGVVNFFAETGHAGARHLVASAEVDVLCFTGSTATGQRIMADAAPTMKKLSLELGGKSCALVFEDVEPADIAPKLAAAATIISGQQCTAARRVLVHESRFDDMRKQLMHALQAVRVGSGLDPVSQMGPLIDWQSRDRVAEQMNRAYASCDDVVLESTLPKGKLEKGAYLTPGLITHGDDNAFFCQEEIFGPLLVLERFSTEAEAISKANNTRFGLSASVWTEKDGRGLRVARALANGTVWLNDHNKLFAEAETGGYRQSGIGRLHGYDALNDFTELKHVYQNCGVAK